MRFDTLRQKITDYCEANQIFGMLRVTVGGKIEYTQTMGFADIEKKIPFSDDSMFTFYSLSKPFCALGLLKLKDKGLVNLDDHPGKYVPEAKGFDERVTIRQMLQHISGLPDFEQNAEFAAKYAPGLVSKTREHMKLLTAYPNYFEPGTAGRYTNINFVLSALIIENVSGMQYADYMKQEVFEPLGMKTAVVDNEDLFIPNRVQGYDLQDGVPVPVEKWRDWAIGAGDIVGTLDDVYCLNLAIKNRLLLKPETWEEALIPTPVNKKALGSTVIPWHGKHRIFHNGGHKGFRTLHLQLPEDDFDIILLSNSGYGDARNDLIEFIYEAFYGEDGALVEKMDMDTGYIR